MGVHEAGVRGAQHSHCAAQHLPIPLPHTALHPAPLPPPPRTFLDLRMWTRLTPGTGFMPSFCIALRLFFSERDCLPRAPPSSSGAGRRRICVWCQGGRGRGRRRGGRCAWRGNRRRGRAQGGGRGAAGAAANARQPRLQPDAPVQGSQGSVQFAGGPDQESAARRPTVELRRPVAVGVAAAELLILLILYHLLHHSAGLLLARHAAAAAAAALKGERRGFGSENTTRECPRYGCAAGHHRAAARRAARTRRPVCGPPPPGAAPLLIPCGHPLRAAATPRQHAAAANLAPSYTNGRARYTPALYPGPAGLRAEPDCHRTWQEANASCPGTPQAPTPN